VDKLEHTGTGPYEFRFTAYLLRESTSSYIVKTITGPGQYFIAPQRAIGLIAAEERTSLDVLLKPGALVAMSGSGTPVHEPRLAPRRASMLASEPYRNLLYISAANETNEGVHKAFITVGEASDATRGFQVGEDALSLNSGLSYYSEDAFTTPLGLYTIADNQPLMLDMRDTLGRVPLVFTTLDSHYTYSDETILSFATEGQWNTPLYLYDALTNDSVMILNGMQIAVQTPQSDQIRYFINGAPNYDKFNGWEPEEVLVWLNID
jgi:hypothetical protein